MKQSVKILFAEKCAWRAIYIYIGANERKVFHLGIDPTSSSPQMFGSLLSWHWRVYLPYVRWSMGHNKFQRFLYKHQQTFLHRLDGRFNKAVR